MRSYAICRFLPTDDANVAHFIKYDAHTGCFFIFVHSPSLCVNVLNIFWMPRHFLSNKKHSSKYVPIRSLFGAFLFFRYISTIKISLCFQNRRYYVFFSTTNCLPRVTASLPGSLAMARRAVRQ